MGRVPLIEEGLRTRLAIIKVGAARGSLPSRANFPVADAFNMQTDRHPGRA